MERTDDLQRGGLKLIQDTGLFCFGTDAVLLADFADIRKGQRIVDFGCASGAVMLLMYARQNNAEYIGIEIQPALYELCQKNIDMNGLSGRVRAICGDIKAICRDIAGTCDAVVANPPYEGADTGILPSNPSHVIARFEVEITFASLCVAAAAALKHAGSFFFIHRVNRLPELLNTAQKAGLAPKRVRFVHKNLKSGAEYALVECVKGARTYLKVQPPLIMYNDDGTRTDELTDIYEN